MVTRFTQAEKCVGSFTTHIWSFDVGPISLPVSPSKFTLQSAVLQVNNFHGSHTGTSITETMQAMLIKLYIPKSYVYLVFCDIVGNVEKDNAVIGSVLGISQ